jgi:hypothetical protein
MKKILIALTAFIAAALATQAQTTIASWGFEPDPLAVSLTNAAFPSVGSYAADNGGSGQLTAVHASNNTVWSSPSGNGSANSLSANNWTTGDYFQFQFSTLTFSNIAITWSQARSGTGVTNFSLRYSTDGASFVTYTNYTVEVSASPNAWTTASNNSLFVMNYDLSSITALDNQPDVYLRLVAEQTSASTGTGRIDDVTITGVPEPSTYALLAVSGLALAGYAARRRQRD